MSKAMKVTITQFLLLLLIISYQPVFATDEAPLFEQNTSFDKLCVRARYEKKPVLLLISSKSCAAFRNYRVKVLSDSSIIDLYGRNFLCYNVDIDSREGRRLANQFNALIFPAIIYLSPERDVIFRSNGTDKVTAAATEAIRVLKVMQTHQQVVRQALRVKSLTAINRKHQRKVAEAYAQKDFKAGKTDVDKQVFEYTLNNADLRIFRKTYIKTMQKI
jgi:hypothetical protein